MLEIEKKRFFIRILSPASFLKRLAQSLKAAHNREDGGGSRKVFLGFPKGEIGLELVDFFQRGADVAFGGAPFFGDFDVVLDRVVLFGQFLELVLERRV